MATQRQIAANRRNALHSTGPKTEAGKAASSSNALRHGFAAEHFVLAVEDEADFEGMLAEFSNEHDPRTPTEHALVEQIAINFWRLRRIRWAEADWLSARVDAASDHLEDCYDHPTDGQRLGPFQSSPRKLLSCGETPNPCARNYPYPSHCPAR